MDFDVKLPSQSKPTEIIYWMAVLLIDFTICINVYVEDVEGQGSTFKLFKPPFAEPVLKNGQN